MTYDPTCVALNSAATSGVFNFVLSVDEEGNPDYLNAQPNSGKFEGNVVSWGNANTLGTANSAWKFVPLTEDIISEPILKSLIPESFQIVTLPYRCTGYNLTGYLYKIMGKEDGNLVLRAFEPDEEDYIAAGTPFVMDMSEFLITDGDCSEGFFIDGVTEENEDNTYSVTGTTLTNKPLTINGTVGLFESEILPSVGAGYLSGDTVLITTEEMPIKAEPFSGYFNSDLPEVVAEGEDVKVVIDGEVTGIKNAKIVNNNTLVNVYTTAGVLIRKNVNTLEATKGLSKGVYIIGNKKVLVK